MGEIAVVPLTPDRADACVAVIATLPEWFGYQGALESVGSEAAHAPGFVALDRDEVVGFVTTAPLFDETLEITYLAVHREARRHGIGRLLVAATCEMGRELGVATIVLITLGPSSGSAPYAETVAFYRAIGFWRTKEIHNTDWGGAPSLVMNAPIELLEAGVRPAPG